jgi:hypothetical protein
LGWPTLKVPAAPYRWAALVNRSVPPGTHVAVPSTIDPWIGTFESHADSVIVRHYLWAKPGLAPDEIQRRVWLRDSVTAPEKVEAAPWQFVEALDRFQVGAVCLANTARADTARAILQEAGFRRTIRDDTYELWLRTPGAVSSDGAVTEHPAAAEADPLSPPGRASAEPRR